MILTQRTRRVAAVCTALLIAVMFLVVGNQRQAHAQTAPSAPQPVESQLGTKIVCRTFSHINTHGQPVDIFPDECPAVPPPPAPAQCADGKDNDGDALIDQGDPGCHSDRDTNNPSSYNPLDNNESNPPLPPPAPQCDDGLDNDNDGLIDFPQDPGCTSANDTTESPNPSGTGTQCSDGVDNDGDNLVDNADPGCSSPQDDNETNDTGGGGGSPQCSDGNDNDSDGLVDYPADPGCSSEQDDDETDPTSGGGSNTNDDDDNGGGGSSHRSSGSSRSSVGEVLGAAVCTEFLQDYVRYGAQNDADQVARLQYVLRWFEGAQIEPTSVYDAATLAAVNAFQRKYADEILAPWNLEAPTGYVYYTTRKKINEVFCQGTRVFPLTVGQLNEVARVSVQNEGGTVSSPTIGTAKGGIAPAALGATLPATGIKPQTGATLPAASIKAQTGTTKAGTSTVLSATSTTQEGGWWSGFFKWLFGR